MSCENEWPFIFARQVYIVIYVAALQTAKDCSSLLNRTAPDAAGSPRKSGSPLSTYPCRCAPNLRREQASELAAEILTLSLPKGKDLLLLVPFPFLSVSLPMPGLAALTTRFFHHVHHRQRDVAFERDLKAFQSDIASLLKEFHAGQRGAHFKAGKSRGAGSGFAGIQQQGTNALARPVRMNKECAYFGGITGGIKQVILAIVPAVTAVERLSLAPAATSDDDGLLPIERLRNSFNQQVCAIVNELAINAEDGAQCAIDLLRRVVLGLQMPHGSINQRVQDGY